MSDRARAIAAALLCVEAGIEASKAYDAFKAEYKRVSREFDKLPSWNLDAPERPDDKAKP